MSKSLGIGKLGKGSESHYFGERQNFVPPVTFGPATVTGTYTGPKWQNARAAGLDASKIKSKGLG